MSFWNPTTVEKARILAEAGYSLSEAAIVMGVTKSSIVGRSARKSEFQFTCRSRGTPYSKKEWEKRIEAARRLIENVTPPDNPHTAKPRIPKERFKKINLIKTGANYPKLHRVHGEISAPLNDEEKKLIFIEEGASATSVSFMKLKDHHCRWIVSPINGIHTMFCGEYNKEGSSYCERHQKRSVSTSQPRRLKLRDVRLMDRNIVQKDLGKEMSSSLLKKN